MVDITALIVDDRPLMLHALQTLIENEDSVSTAGTAENGKVAVEAAESLQPDLVLIDTKMPRLNGIEATRKIASEILGARVLTLTTFSTLDYVVSAFRVGATGYLAKDARPDKIPTAIRNAMDDSLLLSSSVVRLTARRMTGGALDTQTVTGATATGVGFASREISMLQFLGNGLSNREIAKKMHISEGPVKTYLTSAYIRLGIRDRLQAVIWGLGPGIVGPRSSAGEQPMITQDPQRPSHQSALSLQAPDLILPSGLVWFGDGDDAAAIPEKEPKVHN